MTMYLKEWISRPSYEGVAIVNRKGKSPPNEIFVTFIKCIGIKPYG
jgi:hypothetical protein